MRIEDEGPAIEAAIRRVVTAAFGRPDEATLVDDLRRSGDLLVSRVAIDGDAVVGHAALSRLASPPGGVALAPVSVIPERQRGGIGSALVDDCIAVARRRDYRIMFVLGDPTFYARFGFSADAARPFASPYAGPHLMAVQLAHDAVQPAPLVYAGAFNALG